MSFAINPSLTHIDIPESNILELYRSKGEVQLSDTRFRGHPCEAFICISRVDKTVSACVALLEKVMTSIFVYTSDFSAEQSKDYPKVLEEALNFTASFGFAMEKINLDFSPAMREVIIKGISVMREPKKRVKLRSLNPVGHLEPVAPVPPATTEPIPTVLQGKGESDQVEVQSLLAELSSARAVIEKITREKLTLEQNATREIATLKSSVGKVAEAKRSSEERLAKEIETLKMKGLASDNRQQDDLVTSLKAELETALSRAESIEKTLSADIVGLNEKIRVMESETQDLEHELSAENSSLIEKVSTLTKEKESLNSLLSSAKSAAADKIASLALLETSWKESQQREEDLCRNIDVMHEQISRLEADLEKHRQQMGREEALQARIETLQKEVDESRVEIGQLTANAPDRAALEVELKGLTEAKNDVEAEYIRMANEAMEKEAAMLEALYDAEAEILRLSRELELQQQVAQMEMSALRNELKQLVISGAGSMKPVKPVKPIETTAAASSPSQTADSRPAKILPLEPEPSRELTTASQVTAALSALAAEADIDVLPEDEGSDEPVTGDLEITRSLTNEFGNISASSHSSTEFRVDPGLGSIEYTDPAQVVALLYSSNTVQAVPDNSKPQRCKGFIIAVKKDGEYRVYVAWYLTESHKVVICTPEQQPADAEECTLILQDAVSYFEIVGFMMELEDLGSTVKSYQRAIRKVPALSRK